MRPTVAPYIMALSASVDAQGFLVIRGSVPGLYLAGRDHDAVWRDLGPALKQLMKANDGWPDEWPKRK